MKLVSIINYNLVVADTALLIRPIRELFLLDKSPKKENFYRQMSYLYFVYDPRSDYYYMNEEDRKKKTIKQEGLPDNFKPSKKLEEVIELYVTDLNKNAALMLLQDTQDGFNKLRQYIKDMDFDAEDEKGKPKYSLSSIISALKQIPSMAEDFNKAQKSIEKDLEEKERARGGNDNLTVFEDGL